MNSVTNWKPEWRKLLTFEDWKFLYSNTLSGEKSLTTHNMSTPIFFWDTGLNHESMTVLLLWDIYCHLTVRELIIVHRTYRQGSDIWNLIKVEGCHNGGICRCKSNLSFWVGWWYSCPTIWIMVCTIVTLLWDWMITLWGAAQI